MARRRHPRPLAFLLKATDSHCEEYSFAVVTFTETQLLWYRDILALAEKMTKEEPGFSSLSYYDYDPAYFSSFSDLDYVAEDLGDELDYGDWMRIPWEVAKKLKDESEGRARTDCDRVNVYDHHLYWSCYIKNTGYGLETETLYKEQLLGLCKEAQWFETEEPINGKPGEDDATVREGVGEGS